MSSHNSRIANPWQHRKISILHLLIFIGFVLAFFLVFGTNKTIASEVLLDPTRIIYQAAERNLSALLLGIMLGAYFVSNRFKLLERIDTLENNQRRQIRLLKAIATRLNLDAPDSSIPDNDEN